MGSEYAPETIFVHHTRSRRTYKVCTYTEGLGKDKLGVEYRDLTTGEILFKTPGHDTKTTIHDLVLYDTKAAAVSAANMNKSSKLPRVLVGFDSWRGVKRRVRDFPSS